MAEAKWTKLRGAGKEAREIAGGRHLKGCASDSEEVGTLQSGEQRNYTNLVLWFCVESRAKARRLVRRPPQHPAGDAGGLDQR